MSEALMNALWDAVTQQVYSLALDVPVDNTQTPPKGGGLIPVYKRKLVRAERPLDAITQITIFRPEQPELIKYYDFNHVSYKYTFIIALMYPGNQNMSALQGIGNVDIYSQHRDTIKEAFATFTDYPVLGVEGAFDMRLKPDVFLPRSMIAIGYDYQAIGVDISTVE